MDEERFVSARENPRNLAGFSNDARVMPGEASAPQKPMPTILDRFKAVLRDREDDMRVSMAGDDQDVPPPTSEEVVRLYEQMLSELTFNSKPIITDLTIIAGDQREHGEGIAEAICARILEVPAEQKLPSLYLLDSIVKNIGKEYVRYFSLRLPEVFCEAYRRVQPNLYPAMRHLFGTWSTVFPASVLRKIEAQLQFSPSANRQSPSLTSLRASESPRPTHGIHVNPKYLEARHQFEHSTADSNSQPARGTSSTSKNHRQKPDSGYDERDSENVEAVPSQVGAPRLSSTGHATRGSFSLGAEKVHLPSASRLLNSSPFRIEHGRSLSPPIDDIAMDNSPRRVMERASPSRLGFEYGHGRITGREEQSSHWPGKRWSDSSYKLVETSPLYPNGIELQRPRALIDAYGSDERNQTSSKPLKVDMNGMDNKFNIKTWQNTEEEEFDWEDMTPNLSNRRQNNDLPSSSGPPRFRTRPGYGTNIGDADFRRSNHLTQARISIHKDSSVIPEDSDPTVSSGRGSSSNITGLRENTTKFMSSRYPQGRLNFLGQPSHRPLNAVGNARNFQMLGSSGAERRPLISGYPDVDAHPLGSSSNVSRIGATGLDTWKSEALSGNAPPSTGAWNAVTVQKLLPFPVPHLPSPQKQTQSKFESTNANQALNKSILPEHQFSNIGNKTVSSIKPLFPNQQAGSILLNPQNAGQVASVQKQLLLPKEARQNLVPPTAIPPAVSVPSLAQTLTHGYTSQGPYTAGTSVLSNPIPGVHPPIPILNAPGGSIHLQGGGLPPLPPGPRPPSQMIPLSHNPVPIASNPQGGGVISGLISSLMAQGLISLTKEAPVEDSVGLEFNPDILKVRHESAITALYTGLPRQCTTCGLRFKSQEEHSSHMDWHVTKNRVSKNRKQKPSRKWFVSVSMWLTGAEALGTDAVPGFLPAESIVEKKDDEEFSVPADEDQNVCALCGEPFDDFYSDETEEWMYKGAVYMNAPSGSTAGMDRSQLGPIVHAKCRSESSVVSEGFGPDERGYTEEGSQRKRLKT